MTRPHLMTHPDSKTYALALAGALWAVTAFAAEDAASLTKTLATGDTDERAKAAGGLADLGSKATSAVPALVKALGDQDANVRAHAAYALGQVGDQRSAVVDGLFALAADREALVRRAAIRALKSLKLPRDVSIPKMVSVLKRAAPADAAAVVASLAEAGEEAVPFLIDCLGHQEACYWACLALADIGPGAAAAVPSLVKLEQRQEPEVRLQALVALGQIGPAARSAAPTIVKALESDKHDGVRYAAAYAIGEIGASDPQSRAALAKALDSKDAFLQVVAAWALARVAKGDAKIQTKATQLIVAGLKSDKVEVRRAAARALAEINPPPETTAPLLIQAIHDSDPSVIANAVDAMASLGPKIVPRVANNGLKNKDLRLYAVRILAKIGPDAKEAAPALAEALKGSEGDFRREAQFVLGAFGADAAPAVPELIKSLDSDDEQVRNGAIYALGKIGPAAKAALPSLRRLRESDEAFVRFAATWALVKIDPKNRQVIGAAVTELQKGLSDERPLVRLESAAALGELGAAAKSAVPELNKVAADENADVSAAAKRAIEEINRAGN